VGGGGYRALVAAAAAGALAVYGGRIGTGPFGDLVRAALAARDIDAPLPPVPEVDTGFVVALLEPDGERTFATVRGAESAAPELGLLDLAADDLVHVHGYGLVDAERAAAVTDRVLSLPAATTVLLDPGPFGADADPDVLDRLLARVDWWSGNGAEAAAATGLVDPRAAATALASRVRAGAVVRLGPHGCVLARRGAPPELLPAPPVRAVDTIGAGDTHVGTFLAALARGGEPSAAATTANAAAATFVSTPR
jgi:sugar/nucleoside kinase (ribokinase family)